MTEHVSEIEIRAFEPEDMDAVSEILNRPKVARMTLQVPHTPRATRRAQLETYHPDVRLVALIEGRVVGNVSLSRDKGRRLHTGAIGLVVHDAYARRGCGRALMREVLEIADNWLGLRRVGLSVYVDNIPAIRLYEACGFETEGVLRDEAFRDGGFVDTLMMARLRR